MSGLTGVLAITDDGWFEFLRDARLRMPHQREDWPSPELLRWHEESVFVA